MDPLGHHLLASARLAKDEYREVALGDERYEAIERDGRDGRPQWNRSGISVPFWKSKRRLRRALDDDDGPADLDELPGFHHGRCSVDHRAIDPRSTRTAKVLDAHGRPSVDLGVLA